MDKYTLANAFVDAFSRYTTLNTASQHEFSRTFQASGLSIINAIVTWELEHEHAFTPDEMQEMAIATEADAPFIATQIDKKITQAQKIYGDDTPWDAVFSIVAHDFLVRHHSMPSL